MKKLKRIRLINWHRFTNETINFNTSVLLSGENAAGKSTILDAIQLVLTCSKNNFNKAANEKGERNIISYVRCKTGKENKPFERTGYITGHVALEFYDEERKKSFILGTVTDTTSDTNEKTIWYRIDDCILEDTLFFDGKIPKKIDDFKKNKKVKSFIQSEAKRNFKLAYGNVEDKFFELIPKALAFKPINDIKDFVYSYVLDKKEVNIDILKENVRTYQEFEYILKVIKEKIKHLIDIEDDYNKILSLKKWQKKYDYYIKKILVLIEEEKIQKLENKIIIDKKRLERLILNEKEVRDEISNIETQKKNLEIELFNDSEYIALNDISREIEKIERQVKILKPKKQDFNKNIKKATSLLKSIIEKIGKVKDIEDCLNNIENFEQSMDEGELQVSIEAFEKYREVLRRKITEERVTLSNERKATEEQLHLVNKKIKELENRKLQYDSKLLLLIDEIKKSFIKVERTVEPRILCELLNVTNPEWKNAVEGYLNTQRFYIIVSPEDFDLAQRVYTRVKREKNIHSIGLVNTAKLEKYIEPKENTLSAVVTSKSHLARSFANMILSKVSLCENVDRIKEYKCAITSNCMLYQNHVLRAINPEIYNKPFIGEDAYKIQLIQAKEEKELLNSAINELKLKIEMADEKLKLLEEESLTTIKHTSDIIPSYKRIINKLEELKSQKKIIEDNNTFMEKKLLVNELEEKIKCFNHKLSEALTSKGEANGSIKNNNNLKLIYEEQLKASNDSLNREKENVKEFINDIESEFPKLINDKSLEKAELDAKKYKENLTTRIIKEMDNLTKNQYDYKIKYDFGAQADLNGVKLFIDELNNLRSSQVLTYEEKVQKARESAEEEFKEQFLSRIKENIVKAQSEFKNLNKALKDIKFGNEGYEFKQTASKKYNKYYKMIMDDFNMVECFSLLSGQFNENHKEVINELFDKLTNNDENNFKTLEEFTDYRTYMDYDIVIKNGEDIIYYSKVSKEKSGGETQTPFYVTIAASFVQLYKNSFSNSIGLIMFDEAFDKMDDERISGVLEFLTKLPLQLIIAAPPAKIEYIGPMVNKILVALKDDNVSYVEEFDYEQIQESNIG